MLEVFADQLTSVGGPVLVALLALSIAATTAAFFKIFQFVRMGVGRHGEARVLLQRWIDGDERVVFESASSSNATTNVLHSALSILQDGRGDSAYARRIGVQTASEKLARMGSNIRVLEAVVQAAPMLGLLGTIIGMIDAFAKLSEASGAIDPALLAGGIWIALTTTAVGLTIAVPFYFLTVWLDGRIDSERLEMESLLFHATERPAET